MRFGAPITQHVKHEVNQTGVEEEGSEEVSVVTEVSCEVHTLAPIDAEDLPASKHTKPKRPRN